MKTGQFTILVVLGVVAIVALLATILISLRATQEETQADQQQLLNEYLSSTDAREYVRSCLDATAKQAMVYLGKRGGVYWDNGTQGYVDPDSYFTGHRNTSNDVRVPYVINHTGAASYPFSSNNTDPSNSIHSSAYPAEGVAFPDLTAANANANYCYGDCGFFGVREEIPLCDVAGPNNPPIGTPGGCESYTTNPSSKLSLEYGLNNYTERALSQCFNPDQLQQGEVNIEDDPDVQYVFGADTVTVNASYPISFTQTGTGTTTVNFQRTVDIPYLQYFRTFYYILEQEVLSMDHQLAAPAPSPYLDAAAYNTSIKTTASNGDRLFVLEANESDVSEPLVLQGWVKNRRPIINPSVNLDITESDSGSPCSSIEANTKLNVTDPDQDALALLTASSSSPIKTAVNQEPDGTYNLTANITSLSSGSTQEITLIGIQEKTYGKADEVEAITSGDITFECS